MDIQTNEIALFMRGFCPQIKAMPKARGRPRKRNKELFARVVRAHRLTTDWFEQVHGRAPRSDIELFTVLRAHLLTVAQSGGREMQILSAGYTVKTVQNLLGEARRYFREHPENGPFLGVDSGQPSEFNRTSPLSSGVFEGA